MPIKKTKVKPAPRKKPKDNRTPQQRRDDFLKAYAATCNVLHAARKAGIERRRHYAWLETDPHYAEAFSKVKEHAIDYLEAEAIRRSTAGWLEPVFYQGMKCGQVKRFDGSLLQFLLRGLRPQVYGHKTEVTGPQGKPIEGRIEVVFIKAKPLPEYDPRTSDPGAGGIPGSA